MPSAGVRGQLELARPQAQGLIACEREGGGAELARIDAQQEVVHDRVADRGQRQQLGPIDACLIGHLVDQRAQRIAHGRGHLGRAAGVHHGVGDAAHQVLAEADLRVHEPARGQHLTAVQVAQMAGDGGRADIDRKAKGTLDEARPDADQACACLDRDRDLPIARAQRRLQALQHGQIAGERADLPLRRQRLLEALEVAALGVHVGWGDLDIVQAHDRIERDRPHLGPLAHDLPVHLALGRNVDHNVAEKTRLAAQPMLAGHALAGTVAGLDLVGRADMALPGADAVLGELAFGDADLAAAAQAPPAADRIDVDAERARRLQKRRALGEPAALAGRGKDDERLVRSHGGRHDLR